MYKYFTSSTFPHELQHKACRHCLNCVSLSKTFCKVTVSILTYFFNSLKRFSNYKIYKPEIQFVVFAKKYFGSGTLHRIFHLKVSLAAFLRQIMFNYCSSQTRYSVLVSRQFLIYYCHSVRSQTVSLF